MPFWIDSEGIRIGEHFDDEIEKHLLACSECLVVLSPDARESDWVKDEWEMALDEGKPVWPLLYRKCRIPLRLRRKQYVDFTLNEEDGFATLLRRLGEEPPNIQWYRRFQRVEYIVGLAALLAVLIGLIYVALNWHSSTSVTFTRAGANLIYARVHNAGLTPSTMQSYWLRFGGGPIDDVELFPVDIKTSVIPGHGQSDLVLLARKLVPSPRTGMPGQYTCAQVDSLLKNKKVTLSIGVDESNARGTTRTVSFNSYFIHDLIQNKLVCKEE